MDISSVTIIVRDQQEALRYYTETLGFQQRADMPMGEGKRWITVAPPDARVVFVLQPHDWFEGDERAAHEQRLGKDPTIVLRVDNCEETYAQLTARGVTFSDAPTPLPYGIQAVMQDLYGNQIVLLEQQWAQGATG
jgi:catechol 2,3-dioxygenase-like lactoylglutathione lyase family enzyme